ncbi:MAG: DUF1640 domain-containing protein [Magnetococcales bacterium]|nr:DUF1640 domain-containing protein [Magnetococcales bacterium]
MATTTFDTLKFTKHLEASGISREHAEAFSEAFKAASESQVEGLTTKADLKALEDRVMGELRLNRWMLALVVVVTVIPALKGLFFH